MNSFWVKYTFRFLHISTVVALGGKIIYDYIFPCGTNEISKQQAIFAAVAGTILMLSGFINIFILRGKEKMQDNHKFWTGVLHTKFLTSILVLTPLNKLMFRSYAQDVAFYYVVAMLLISPYLRFYREYWTEENKFQKFQ